MSAPSSPNNIPLPAAVSPEEVVPAGTVAGGIALPRFVEARPDGLYVDLAMLESAGSFAGFANKVFSTPACAYFVGLDYPVFQLLLYEADSPQLLDQSVADGDRHLVRFAREVLPFAVERRALYRTVKMTSDGSAAEYFFEPLSLERQVEVADFGPPDETGAPTVTGSHTETVAEPAFADIDEFVAAMWDKGIRFGLDLAAIQAALTSQKSERLEIARARPPTTGQDAGIVEQTEALHRDDAPKQLANGRIDLCQFTNRFPQVKAGTRLLQKTPRQLGVGGFTVDGRSLEPELPKDFDLQALAGPGTRIEHGGDGECIVAAMDGFLNIEAASNQISISDKIIDHHGVSARTTGNLSLTGADFEERGEVQERRVVEGHNMAFLADVFGNVVSDGGMVELKMNLAGGTVKNSGGTTLVAGSVSRASIEDREGTVQLATAEGSVIVGRHVIIKTATNCEILADEVEIENCVGCGVAARVLRIGNCDAWRNAESVLTLLQPDTTEWDNALREIDEEAEALAASKQRIHETVQRLSEPPEVSSFLRLRAQLARGEITLTAPQRAGWETAQARLKPVLAHLERLPRELKALETAEAALAPRRAEVIAERDEAMARATCAITQVSGETVVRRRRAAITGLPFRGVSAKDFRASLRDRGAAEDILACLDGGSFAWPPEDAQEP
ncbi:MAG TPA: flagellar assembly protein A [Rhodocyclaceae bacterium]